MSKVSLIKGTGEWPGDYYPGKLLIGKSHWRVEHAESGGKRNLGRQSVEKAIALSSGSSPGNEEPG